jgi:hypothetical protein
VDALLIDPPFGIGFNYKHREECNDPVAYWEWLSPIYTDCLSKLRVGGFSAVWQAQRYFRHFWEWFGEDIHIYAGAKNFVQLRKVAIQYGYDPIIISYHGVPLLRPSKPKRNIDFFVANTAKWVMQTKDIVRRHPCPRPIDQVEQLISNFVLDGGVGVILDSFLGSGTTALVAGQLNRYCIGIEISEEYCEIAAERCAADTIERIQKGEY